MKNWLAILNMEEEDSTGSHKTLPKIVKMNSKIEMSKSQKEAKYSLTFIMRNQSRKYDLKPLRKAVEDDDDDLSRDSDDPEPLKMPEVRFFYFQIIICCIL